MSRGEGFGPQVLVGNGFKAGGYDMPPSNVPSTIPQHIVRFNVSFDNKASGAGGSTGMGGSATGGAPAGTGGAVRVGRAVVVRSGLARAGREARATPLARAAAAA